MNTLKAMRSMALKYLKITRREKQNKPLDVNVDN